MRIVTPRPYLETSSLSAPASPARILPTSSAAAPGDVSSRLIGSVPVPLQGERGPVVGRRPSLLAPDRDLRRPKGRRRPKTLPEDSFVEVLHQLGGRAVGHLPEARHDSRRTRVHESAREPQKSLSPH